MHNASAGSLRTITDAARRRGIPCLPVAEGASLVQLGWGTRQKRLHSTLTCNTSHLAVQLAADRQLTKSLLAYAGLPVPQGGAAWNAEEAVAMAAELGGPVVLKPLEAAALEEVCKQLAARDDVCAAFARASRHSRRVLVERHLEGESHRVLVVAGRCVAAALRSPPQVVADGRSTVRALVAAENARRCGGPEPIPLDATTDVVLARRGLTLDSVPAPGARVALRDNASLSTGGSVEDVTERMHPEVAAACVLAALQVGLDVAGIDLVCADVSVPLEEQGGGIIGVTASPALRMHTSGLRDPRRVGDAILATLFPAREDGRIPLVVVTGGSHAASHIARVFEARGLATGIATSEGARIGGRSMCSADRTPADRARAVLLSPEVEAAVIELADDARTWRALGIDRRGIAIATSSGEPPDAIAERALQGLHAPRRSAAAVPVGA